MGSLPATALETVTYAYTDANWKDKLTEFNGSYITYDEIGNPTSDGEWLYAWEKGRQLKAMSKAAETVVYEYNASGLRVKKIATSTGTTNYTLHGKNIVHMIQGNDELHFYYDAGNKPAMVEYNGSLYGYVHNLQGDIVAILDDSGATVVRYTYDAWGKPLSTTGSLAATLGKLNPFRYRGYVYDEETGLYYLKSRYYNANQCRFSNGDSLISVISGLLGKNVFSYCLNNPIAMIDSDGEIPSFVLRVLIHNAVCVDIMATVPGMIGGVGMKVNYDTATNGKMYGYMDLVNIYTLEAYEVKRVGLSIDNAINQLNDYIRNTWVGFRQYFPAKEDEEEEENLKIPKLHQGTNPLIKGSFSFMEYYVEYWYERDGIILYDYYPLPQPQEQPQEERARKKANLPILNETAESISWMEIGVAFATAFAFGIALGGCGNLKTQTCLAN